MAVTLAQLGERTTEVQHFKPSIGFVRSLVRSRQVTVFLRLPGGCLTFPDHFELLHDLFDRFLTDLRQIQVKPTAVTPEGFLVSGSKRSFTPRLSHARDSFLSRIPAPWRNSEPFRGPRQNV